uniref:Uncharacterized protein n=1 Tax=Parascaris equorum TaxID=6256 RepID=A0A914RST8_PAREQ
MPSSTDSNTEYAKINLDETRDELFRALQYEASVQIDALSHEQIRTISEERPVIFLPAATLTSQLICQFFVFGTLFGVVCSISTCTCCLHPRGDRRRNVELSG